MDCRSKILLLLLLFCEKFNRFLGLQGGSSNEEKRLEFPVSLQSNDRSEPFFSFINRIFILPYSFFVTVQTTAAARRGTTRWLRFVDRIESRPRKTRVLPFTKCCSTVFFYTYSGFKCSTRSSAIYHLPTLSDRFARKQRIFRWIDVEGRKMREDARKKSIRGGNRSVENGVPMWTALNAPIENVCKVEGNGGRGSGTIPRCYS